jgi:putative hydrolase of the HAD superfamily
MRNLELYGYGIKGFTLSAIETALGLTSGRISPDEIAQILALGREMMTHPVEVLPGADAVLAALAPHYRLLLITKGDLRDQERKVAKSGLAGRFTQIEIVSEKDQGAYERILRRHAIEPRRFLMVGNSLKSDIVPVLALGASGVHIPYRITWAHEQVEPPADAADRLFRIAALPELPEVVARWSAAR